MRVEEAIRGRRSIRRFEDRPVAEDVLEQVLGLATCSPSSLDGQPWHFIAIRGAPEKRALAEIKNRYCPPEKRMFRADFLASAPVVVAVCVDRERSFGRAIENGVLATATIMLAAHAAGLGTVYMSAHQPDAKGLSEEIRRLLEVPEGIDPVTILPIGYPAETPGPKKVRPLKEVLHLERFGKHP